MSTIDSDDLDATGYFLPEDSWSRLKNLHEYVGFLANLARPRSADEREEWLADIRVGQVSICMELLEEQIGQVLDELSWPAERGKVAALGADAEVAQVEAEGAEAGEPVSYETGTRYAFGVTLRQIDEINLLLDMIREHGDVLIANDAAEFANCTPSSVGHAIFRDVGKLRDIIEHVGLQALAPMRGTRTGVGEERAAYHLLQAPLPAGSLSHFVRPCPTCH